ncbi:hypothetical protein, partial [Halogranum amylolyticum]|uniref:hypothetical protein n=1 Tax=Halogranum amylolyticum TaxID=660520 RepID=UPI001B8CB123
VVVFLVVVVVVLVVVFLVVVVVVLVVVFSVFVVFIVVRCRDSRKAAEKECGNDEHDEHLSCKFS